MARLRLIFATCMSLLTLGLLALGILSYFRFSYAMVPAGRVGILVNAHRGVLLVMEFPAAEWSAAPQLPADRAYGLVGFGYAHVPTPSGAAHRVFVPFYFLVLLAAIYPVVFFRRNPFYLTLKHYRRAHRLCLTCGYDLRAHRAQAISERCPECGTPLPPQ